MNYNLGNFGSVKFNGLIKYLLQVVRVTQQLLISPLLGTIIPSNLLLPQRSQDQQGFLNERVPIKLAEI